MSCRVSKYPGLLVLRVVSGGHESAYVSGTRSGTHRPVRTLSGHDVTHLDVRVPSRYLRPGRQQWYSVRVSVGRGEKSPTIQSPTGNGAPTSGGGVGVRGGGR